MEQSPYLKYSDILLHGKYGTAYRLGELMLGFYDLGRFRLRRDDCWGGFDTRHRGIYQELADWYREHGNEHSFVTVCEVLISRGERHAEELLVELTRLKATNPSDYLSVDDRTNEDSYKAALKSCEYFLSVARSDGFLRD
jgi:hypothetical protein